MRNSFDHQGLTMNMQNQWLFEVPLVPQSTYRNNAYTSLEDYNERPHQIPAERIDPVLARDRLDEAKKAKKSAETKRDNAWFGEGRAKPGPQKDRATKARKRWEKEVIYWSEEVKRREADLQAAERQSGQQRERETESHWLFEAPLINKEAHPTHLYSNFEYGPALSLGAALPEVDYNEPKGRQRGQGDPCKRAAEELTSEQMNTLKDLAAQKAKRIRHRKQSGKTGNNRHQKAGGRNYPEILASACRTALSQGFEAAKRELEK